MSEKTFLSLNIAILKISDTRNEQTDDAGRLLIECVENAGHQCLEKVIVRDNRYQIRAEVSRWISEQKAQVVITTGGTGMTGRDGTPEAIKPLLDKVLEGFGEQFRALSFEKIAHASMLSRAIAGLANGVLIFCLPGSKSAILDGWNLIAPLIDSRTKPCNLASLMPRFLEHEKGCSSS